MKTTINKPLLKDGDRSSDESLSSDEGFRSSVVELKLYDKKDSGTGFLDITQPMTPPESRHRAHSLFKAYMVASMVFFWTGYTLLVRYTRITVPPSKMYASSTIILMTEILKFVVTIFFLLKEANFSIEKFNIMLNDEFISKPWELLKMSVPSVAYALQNNLDFVSLSNLDAGVYQIVIQLKIISAALFMMLILRRSFSFRRWVAIILLFAGVAFVQLSKLESTSSTVPVPIKSPMITTLTHIPMTAVPTIDYSSTAVQNPLVGMIAVLCTCAIAGFAGVYFEMMLKDGSTTPFWIRNLQMYTCGLVSTCIGCFLYDSERIADRGFFFGYNSYVLLIILFLGLGGIFISLIMKYMDNLYKSFASSISIIFVVLFSVFIFNDTKLNGNFVVGSIAVCVAVILYNSGTARKRIRSPSADRDNNGNAIDSSTAKRAAQPSTLVSTQTATSGEATRAWSPTSAGYIATLDDLREHFACTWKGIVTLKKINYPFGFHRIYGKEHLLQDHLRDENGAALRLHITQRLRVDNTYYQEIIELPARELAIMIGVDGTPSAESVVHYLQEKNAAGLVTLANCSLNILPQSAVVERLLNFFAPRLLNLMRSSPTYMLVLLRKTISITPTQTASKAEAQTS